MEQRQRLGHNLVRYDLVGSTNQVAKGLAEDLAPEGTTVLADRQSAGEGRLGRKWLSGPEGLWFSVVFRPQLDTAYAPQITLLAAVAVSEAIHQLGLTPGIKWPNDILIKGRKVCGILTEMNIDRKGNVFVVLGIGINLNHKLLDFSEDLQATATSIAMNLGRTVDRLTFLKDVLARLDTWYILWQDQGFAPIRKAWKKHTLTLRQTVKITSCEEVFYGEALDINDFGELLVKDQYGQVCSFNCGEVSLQNVTGMGGELTF